MRITCLYFAGDRKNNVSDNNLIHTNIYMQRHEIKRFFPYTIPTGNSQQDN